MANPVLLNNVDHKDLRVLTTRGAQYGENVHFALTFPSEFRTLQAHYPIVFRKTDDGTSVEPVALLGFEEGENLFLDGDQWDAPEFPLVIARMPFMIGVNGDELMVHIDMDSPRIVPAGDQSGEAVFLPHGGNTDYLERISNTLLEIHRGLQGTPGFIAALLELELLESFVMDVTLDDGSQHRLVGFYTVNEDKLAALSGEVLERLMKAGYLQAIFFAQASLSNLRLLVARKNKRHNAGQG
ncbi:MAG TPA: SapC family protein [Burkholderiaceae bacterium]